MYDFLFIFKFRLNKVKDITLTRGLYFWGTLNVWNSDLGVSWQHSQSPTLCPLV